jgi:transcriptional regulator of acetoin/glycerol metabolism
MSLADAEARQLAHVLELHGGNVRRTAKALGISRTTLYGHMERLGLRRTRTAGEDPIG